MFLLRRHSFAFFLLLTIGFDLILGQDQDVNSTNSAIDDNNTNGVEFNVDRYFFRPTDEQLKQLNDNGQLALNFPTFREGKEVDNDGGQLPKKVKALFESKNPFTFNFTDFFNPNKTRGASFQSGNKDRPFLFNVLYGSFNFYETPHNKSQTTRRPTTRPSPTGMTTSSSTPNPLCEKTECGCCIFNSTDPYYPGYTVIQSPNFPNDYGDDLNCAIRFDPSLNFTCHFTTVVIEKHYDFVMIIPRGHRSQIKIISGYQVPGPISYSFDTPVSFELKIVSGMHGGQSIPVQYGTARKWEVYCSSNP